MQSEIIFSLERNSINNLKKIFDEVSIVNYFFKLKNALIGL